MEKKIGKNSLIEIYNHSERNDDELKKLQTYVKNNGEKIEMLEINGNPMILQTNLSLINLIGNTRKKFTDIANILNSLPGIVQKVHIDQLIIEELESTNEIEGVSTERESVRRYLNQESNTQIKEKNLIEHYLSILKNKRKKVLTSEDIRILYEDFLSGYIEEENINDLGSCFRLDGVEVLTKTNKPIHRGIDGEDNIKMEMDKLLKLLHNEEYELLIRVSIFHYYFGYIHPFYDGNGRVNRLITSIYLYEEMNIAALTLAKVINKNLKQYYKMFEDTNDKRSVGDISYFVYNFIKFIQEASETTMRELRNIKNKIDLAKEKLNYFELNEVKSREKSQRIIYLLYQGHISHSPINISDICEYIEVKSRQTAKKYIDDLIGLGIIEEKKKSKKNVYTLTVESIDKIEK